MRVWRFTVIVLFVVLLSALQAAPVWAEGRARKTVLGEDYTLRSGERLEQDLTVVGGRLTLESGSIIEGDVALIGGEAVLNGEVNGNVVAMGGSVELGATAVIDKDLVVFGAVRRRPGAVVRGNTVQGLEAGKRLGSLSGMPTAEPTPSTSPPFAAAPTVRPSGGLAHSLQSFVTMLAVLLIVALIVVLVPDNMHRTSQTMTQFPLLSLGMGALTMALVVLLLVLSAVLVLICIGIPMAIVLVVALCAGALLGLAAAGDLVGKKVVQTANVKGISPLMVTLIGTLIILVISSVPCIGALVGVVVVSWGLGAVALTRLGTTGYPPAAPFAIRPPTPPAPPTPPMPTTSPIGEPPRRSDTHPLDPSTINDDLPDSP